MAWAPSYATTADLRAYLRVPEPVPAVTDEDAAQMALAITAASRSIDHACGRQFGNVDASTTRYYTARWSRERVRYLVEVDDLYDDSATITSDDTAVTDFTFEPRNAEADGRPYTVVMFGTGVSVSSVWGEIAVTSTKWGWSAVPDTIKNATLLQASRIFKRRDAPFGVAGSPEMGSELRLLARLDPDVDVLVRAYYRWWGMR